MVINIIKKIFSAAPAAIYLSANKTIRRVLYHGTPWQSLFSDAKPAPPTALASLTLQGNMYWQAEHGRLTEKSAFQWITRHREDDN